MTVLAIASDAYGSGGGIAQVNRDLYPALVSHPGVDRVRVLSRVPPPEGAEGVPPGVELVNQGGAPFVEGFTREVARGGYGLVVCSHVHLSAAAAAAAARARCPWVLVVHGIEVWGPPHWPATQGRLATALTGYAVRDADRVVSVSEFTKGRFCQRFGVDPGRVTVVPNSVDLSEFGPGPPREELLRRYGLEGRTVLMTLARLSSAERYKGVDEVIECLPALAQSVPNVSYLVCGGGEDRGRLEEKAAALGVVDRVVFAGFVPEDEKTDHYRLADAFVMPGRGEGFGIVLLEAMASGVPVVASSADASHEAVLHGDLGSVVDPEDLASVVEGICDALSREKGVPSGLDYFSRARFVERWHRVVDDVYNPSSNESSSYDTPLDRPVRIS